MVEQRADVAVILLRQVAQIDTGIQTQAEHQRLAQGRPAFQSLSRLAGACPARHTLPVSPDTGRVAPPLAVNVRGGADPEAQVRLIPPVDQVVPALVTRPG